MLLLLLDLRGGSGENAHGAGRIGPVVRGQAREVRVAGVRVRRRNVGGAKVGSGRRAGDGLRGRRHHVGDLGAVEHAGAGDGLGGGDGGSMLLVASPGVGVVVYPRVAGELVRAGEALCAAGELAGVGLLSSVGADVTGLVLKAVEGLVTERAFVGTRQVLPVVLLVRLRVLKH